MTKRMLTVIARYDGSV